MTEDFIPTLTHATERDIDLLLVEEFYASHQFVCWIASGAGIRERIESASILHSKRRTCNLREIDIFCDIRMADDSGAAILIENKLDAAEQPDQAESYREDLDVLADRFDRRAMVIVCPMAYQEVNAAFTAKFDAVITYESVAAYFAKREAAKDVNALRYRFRKDLFN